MEKMESRNTRKNVITFFLLIVILISLILTNFYYMNTTNELKNNIEKTQIEIENLKSQIEVNNNEILNLEDELNKLQNIDNEIINIKNEYYKTLKVFEDKVDRKEVNYKIAYLTFDDGPYNLTNKFLDILEEYDVRATFFTIGYDKETCFDNRNIYCGGMYSKIASYGHTMANHTYSHAIFNGLYSNTYSFIEDVKKQEKLIEEKTGITTNIVRFPGGSAQAKGLKKSITNELKKMGYGWVDWTSLNGDGGYVANKEIAMNNFKNTINEDVEVVLFHDYNYVTLSMLPDAIEYLKNNNYVLLPLFYESKMVNK